VQAGTGGAPAFDTDAPTGGIANDAGTPIAGTNDSSAKIAVAHEALT